MVRISVEVGQGAVRYRVVVQAESIRRAVQIVEEMNHDNDFRVVFPIEPETFFVKDPTATAGLIEQEVPAASVARHNFCLTLAEQNQVTL
jgi:hypothetical protein